MASTMINTLDDDSPMDVRKDRRDVTDRSGEPSFVLQTTRTLQRLRDPQTASDDPACLERIHCL